MSKAVTDRIWSNMVEVKGGIFRMGATPEQGSDADEDEIPVHSVTLDDFRICRYPVTQGEWQALMGHHPSHFRRDPNLPVEKVSWEDAQSFIAHLNSMTSGGYRLPTEAQWEYAARGGEKTRGYKYSGSDEVDEVAWTDRNSKNKTHPVGQLKANELGLFDMSGNVWEWCQDWYGEYGAKPLINPPGPASGGRRVMRGGGWLSYPVRARVSNRFSIYPGDRFYYDGFRLAFQG